jgi:hypothetical protein
MRFSEGKTISQRMAMAMLVLASLVAFAGLSGCSGGGSRGRYFAYIQDNNSDDSAQAHHVAHAGVKHPAVSAAARTSRASAATPAATTVTGTQPIAGSDDIIIFDTHTNATALDTGVAFDVESVQVSHDGTELVTSILTPVTVGGVTTNYYELWLADIKFHTVTQITTDANDHYDATFSADGNTIAYWAEDSVKNLEQLFTVTTAAPYTEIEVAKTPDTLNLYEPAFTPDGLSLVAGGDAIDSDTSAIYIVNIASGTTTQLDLDLPAATDTTAEYDYLPAVSPDGTQVSFTREIDNSSTSTYDVYVMPITGSTVASAAIGLTTGLPTTSTSEEPLYLDNSAEDIVYLSWFPNSGTGGTFNPNVFEMERDGTTASLAKTQLTDTPLADFFNDEF